MDFRPLVAQLSREACDGFLCRIAQGDAIAPLELKKQLLGLLPQPAAISGPSLSIEALRARAEAIETALRSRRELEARRKHEAEMNALADREEETWAQVTSLVDHKKTTSYEEAIRLLDSLAKLAEFRGSQTDYRRRQAGLCERYGRLAGFLRRVEQAKLLDEKTQQRRGGDRRLQTKKSGLISGIAVAICRRGGLVASRAFADGVASVSPRSHNGRRWALTVT